MGSGLEIKHLKFPKAFLLKINLKEEMSNTKELTSFQKQIPKGGTNVISWWKAGGKNSLFKRKTGNLKKCTRI